MEEDLNVYYDISSSKWWFFDQSSGTWVEQEEEEVEEYIENNRTKENTEKREYIDNVEEVEVNIEERGVEDDLEQRKKNFNNKTQTMEQNMLPDDSDMQSESEFSYEKAVSRGRTIRKLASGYDIDNLNTENTNENGKPSSILNINYNTSEYNTYCNGNSKVHQTALDNGQDIENEREITKEGEKGVGEGLEANVETNYVTAEGDGGRGIYDNHYGAEYDANTYDSNVNFNNAEGGENYYSFYYDNDANNKYGTGNETGTYAEGNTEGYTEGYGEGYTPGYVNNYYNEEEYNVEGTMEKNEYAETYGAEYNEWSNENGNYNYTQECATYDPQTSENNEELYKEYNKNENTSNYNENKEDKMQEQFTRALSMASTEPKHDSKKEPSNINTIEKKNEENESDSLSKPIRKLSNIGEGINNLLEGKKNVHTHEMNNARLLNKLISESQSFTKSGSKSECSNSDIHSVHDAPKTKITLSNETVTNLELSENENTENKRGSKSKVHFSDNSITTQRKSVNNIVATNNQGENVNDMKQEAVDVETAPIPFVRRVTRNLTFKDQGGLSGCIKVFLEKKNELIAASTTTGIEKPTQDIDIKMANLRRRARELAKRYRSKSNIIANGATQDNTNEAEEDGMTKFHKLVLQVQSQNKKLKEANKGM